MVHEALVLRPTAITVRMILKGKSILAMRLDARTDTASILYFGWLTN